MRTVLLGAAVAAVLGAATGAYSQSQVRSVMADSGGSRLEVASAAVPISVTPWAAGDPTAPQTAAVPLVAPGEARL